MKIQRILQFLSLFLLTFVSPALAQQGASSGETGLPSVSFEGLFYLKHEVGEALGTEFNRFAITRGYLTTRVKILPRLSARMTMDTRQELAGDMKVRLKYAYAKYDFGNVGGLTDVGLEGGLVHNIWLDFEQHIDLYRMRDKMFIERSGLFNSADIGLALMGGFGEELPEEYLEEVSDKEAARWGSFGIGLYNGGGYHALEANQNKVLQGRLTFRPLPDVLPGFQLSGLAIYGKGNRSDLEHTPPDWDTYLVMASYQHARGTLTTQYALGEGNQKGSWFEPDTQWDATEWDGFSVNGELRLDQNWRLIGGFDDFTREPGDTDLSFTRYHGGIGYDLGGGNILLFSYDRRDWSDAALEDGSRFQTVFQVKF